MKDQVEIYVPPHLFDGMYKMPFPIEVDLNKKLVEIDLMPEYGSQIMEDIVKESVKKYPGFEVIISK